jgi:phosphohistidine phosphatase
MRTLILFRHAKSDRSDDTLADFDRPLNDRGREAAGRMGKWLNSEGLVPDLVLCSSAKRTMETWQLAAATLDREVPVEAEERLYLAEAEEILTLIKTVPDNVLTLLVVGHNPGIEALAEMLAASGPKKDLKRMRKKFPTAAVAVLDHDVAHWSEVGTESGHLRTFKRPRNLD